MQQAAVAGAEEGEAGSEALSLGVAARTDLPKELVVVPRVLPSAANSYHQRPSSVLHVR